MDNSCCDTCRGLKKKCDGYESQERLIRSILRHRGIGEPVSRDGSLVNYIDEVLRRLAKSREETETERKKVAALRIWCKDLTRNYKALQSRK